MRTMRLYEGTIVSDAKTGERATVDRDMDVTAWADGTVTIHGQRWVVVSHNRTWSDKYGYRDERYAGK